MAKAVFHKSQRVYVKPVGTWVLVERVVPHWVKDVDEPLRISYDCGLGRLFQAHELASEQAVRDVATDEDEEDDFLVENWRIVRRAIKWRSIDPGLSSGGCVGAYPVIVTDEGQAGGWRVPSAEYDRDPQRIEHQARMIAHTPELLRITRQLAEYAAATSGAMPEGLKPLSQRCAMLLRSIYRLERESFEPLD